MNIISIRLQCRAPRARIRLSVSLVSRVCSLWRSHRCASAPRYTNARAGTRAKKKERKKNMRVYVQRTAGEKGNNTHGVRELHQVSRDNTREGAIENIFVELRIELRILFAKREIRPTFNYRELIIIN